uniref:DUF4758 domain-containing protein n=1 Tax=Strigamia maritima TaxID=126957 RepID=T1IXU2_STRMM
MDTMTGTGCIVASGENATSGESRGSSDSAIVRIVVNTVVSSGNNDQAPIVVNPASQTVNALSFPGGGQHIRPSSSRPEKRKADGSLFFPDGNIMDQGTTQAASHEAAYTGGSQSEEANVHIADYGAGQPQATLPTGLVTTMGGTVVQGGQTTVHETRVIGTYIDGTYAQILQSTSMIFENDKNLLTETTLSSSISSVQSTVISTQSMPTKITISPTPTSSGKWPHLKSRPPYTGIVRNSRSRNIEDKSRQSRELASTSSSKPTATRRNLKSATPRSRSSRKSSIPFLKTITPSASASASNANLQTVTPSIVLSNKKNTRKSRNRSTIHGKTSARNRLEKNNVRPTTNIPKFTYTPNPNKYYIGRRRSKAFGNVSEPSNKYEQSMEARTVEMTSPNVLLSTVMSTITTEITQFFGGKDSSNSLVFTTTYEQPIVLTISKSNSIADVKPSKTMQDVTITSTMNAKFLDDDSLENENIFNPFLEEPLDEEELVSSQVSLATPPLPTFNATSISLTTTTDDVTTTETVFQTSFLPILDGSTTTIFTLTQSFFVTKIIHALRTVPPPEMMSLVVGQDLNAAESEHREDSVYPDIENLLNNTNSDIFNLLNITDNDVTQPNSPPTMPLTEPSIPPPPPPPQPIPQLPVPQYNNNPFLNPYINPFAYLGYGGGVPQPVIPNQMVTSSTAVYSTETIYGTKVLPIWDGLSTSYHTTKAPSTVKIHTSYETYTMQNAGVQNPVMQNPVMPFPPVNNYGPVHTITSSTTMVTTETITSTQVLKLMYDGYKTSYRTLLSTTETVKTVTTQATTTVPFGQMQPFFG